MYNIHIHKMFLYQWQVFVFHSYSTERRNDCCDFIEKYIFRYSWPDKLDPWPVSEAVLGVMKHYLEKWVHCSGVWRQCVNNTRAVSGNSLTDGQPNRMLAASHCKSKWVSLPKNTTLLRKELSFHLSACVPRFAFTRKSLFLRNVKFSHNRDNR